MIVDLTLLSQLHEAEKTTTDLDLKIRFSAKPGHVNHHFEQPYFVQNLSTTISKFSLLENLPFLFFPEMSTKTLFFIQSKTTNLCTCQEWGMLAKSPTVKI